MTADIHPMASGIALATRLLTGTSVRRPDAACSGGARVYFANHTSHMDFAVLWSSLPDTARARTRPVAALDYWSASAPRRYFAQHVFRSLLVDRGGHGAGKRSCCRQTIQRLVRALSEGDSLIIFPEGTRGSGERVAPFRGGLYYLARHLPGLEFVPVYLRNLGRVLPKGEFLPVPLIAEVTFGWPLLLQDGESRDDFLERARGSLCALEAL